MRREILAFYRDSGVARKCLSLPRWMYKVIASRMLSDEVWCRDMFRWAHGYSLDLKSPRTLNEKIQWLKLYNRNASFTRWADKFKVREIIANMFGHRYLVPLLAEASNARQIPFDSLPTPFIIKSSHSSGQTIIIRKKDGTKWPKVIRACDHWMKTNLYREGREWQYKTIPPRILVEELLVDANGNVPSDFKFHCINGRVAVIQVDIDRFSDHRRNFYDPTWSRLPFVWSVCAGEVPLWPQGRDVEKPAMLADLIAMTQRIASLSPYIRVDWYICGSQAYFGEVTFHHGGGYERILPFEWDERFGAMLDLPRRSFVA